LRALAIMGAVGSRVVFKWRQVLGFDLAAARGGPLGGDREWSKI